MLAASAAVGLLTARGANRVGAVMLCGDQVTTVPPRQGRRHLLGILDRVLTAPRADGAGPADLEVALRRIGSMAPRRGMVAVISDFLHDPDRWRTALGSVCLRHAVLCVQVLDPRDVELPPVGVVHLTDPATGATREVITDDPQLRARYAEAAARQQATIAQAIRGTGADHLVLRTDSDWLLDLARHVAGRRRRAEMAAGRQAR